MEKSTLDTTLVQKTEPQAASNLSLLNTEPISYCTHSPTLLILSSLESVPIASVHRSAAGAGSVQGVSSEHSCSQCCQYLGTVAKHLSTFVRPFQTSACAWIQSSSGREVHSKLTASVDHPWEHEIQMWTTPEKRVKWPCGSRRSETGLLPHIHMLSADKITDGQQSFGKNALLYFRGILKIAQRGNTVADKHIPQF